MLLAEVSLSWADFTVVAGIVGAIATGFAIPFGRWMASMHANDQVKTLQLQHTTKAISELCDTINVEIKPKTEQIPLIEQKLTQHCHDDDRRFGELREALVPRHSH